MNYELKQLNSTIGIYYHPEAEMKIANDKWTILSYKNITLLKQAYKQNVDLINSLNTKLLLEENAPRLNYFYKEVQPHINLINKQLKSIERKFEEIKYDIQGNRYKRGLINGIGTIWKSLTGNLDSSDGEYYSDCINKLSNDEHQIENLLKNQISVTTSTIKNFNYTIRKLQIDEETFNKDIVKVETTLLDITDKQNYFEARFAFIEVCEQITESNIIIESELDDIIESITFARLKTLHPSIIQPSELVNQLRKISQKLQRSHLPLLPDYSNIASYFDIIELKAFQTYGEIVFVLNIPIVEPYNFKIYHLYSIPIKDNRTRIFHLILPTSKYIALSDDNTLYVQLDNFENCKHIEFELCQHLLPSPIDLNANCEAQLLLHPLQLPENCVNTLLYSEDFKVQLISENTWLIAITNPIPIVINCLGQSKTEIIKQNSILSLYPTCIAYIGSIRVYAIFEKQSKIEETVQVPQIKYDCCSHLPNELPKLEPLKISDLNLDELNVAEHKLNQYDKDLDKLINEPFVQKHISWFTYFIITLIIALIVLYIMCKCKRRYPKIGIALGNTPGPDYPDDNQRTLLTRIRRGITPLRRQPIRRNFGDPTVEEEIELNPNSQKLTSRSLEP